MDLPRSFTIRESGSRIINPFDEHKLHTLGEALRLSRGASILDLACGKGEMLCTWARDFGYTGSGVDVSSAFIADADARARELGVEQQVAFRHDDAAAFVLDSSVDVASCVGASWIGGGPGWQDAVTGTLALLERSVRHGGVLLLGEPYWKLRPQSQEALAACHANSPDSFAKLPHLLDHFASLGYDVVEVVMADEDSWDRYAASQWLSIRRWLDAHPDDDLYDEFRTELDPSPRKHLLYQRSHLGWGVFVLMRRR